MIIISTVGSAIISAALVATQPYWLANIEARSVDPEATAISVPIPVDFKADARRSNCSPVPIIPTPYIGFLLTMSRKRLAKPQHTDARGDIYGRSDNRGYINNCIKMVSVN